MSERSLRSRRLDTPFKLRVFHQEVDVVLPSVHLDEDGPEALDGVCIEQPVSVFRNEHQIDV